MRTDVQHATLRHAGPVGPSRCDRARTSGRPARPAAAAITLLLMTAGVVTAKSMYVVASITNFDGPIPVHVYDIGADGRLTYQTQFGAPFIGAGMVGIAMDSDSGHLFSTYETSGLVLLTDATTLERRDTLAVQNAQNLAGIVYDHQKRLLYCAEFGDETLYVLSWDPLKRKVTPVLGSPFALKGAEAYGLALDEYSDLLYVASPTQGISVYNTWDWSLVRTMSSGRVAISVAVDPERDYLYYGGGYADNYYLTQRRLSDGDTREVLVDPNAGVMGLGVDPETGLIYITTGRENRPGGKDLMVYDPNLALMQTIEDIGRPTGLVIPIHNTSFNPLHLSKTVKNPLGGKPDDDGLYYVVVGDPVTYSICFDDGGYDVNELVVVDKLPAELIFVDATGHGTFGRYDAATHTYTWENPPLTRGDKTCLEIVCSMQPGTTPGRIITNRVTIDSDKTPPTTIGVGAVTTEATYNPLNISKVVVSPEPAADKSVYARPSQEVTYRICFDNRDNDRAVSNVVLVDPLPQQVQFVGATCDGRHGVYDSRTHTYTWTWASLAATDANCVDLVVRLSADVPAGAILTNSATIKSDQTPQVSKEASITVAFAAMEIEKSVISHTVELDDRGRPTVGRGEKVTYKILVRNPSRNIAVTQVAIVDALPREMTFVSAQGDRDFGSYDSAAHTFTWEYPLLTAGSEASLELVAQVNDAVEPNTVISNAVTITSRQAPPSEARADVVVRDGGTILAQMFLRPTHIWRNQSKATPELMVIVHLPEGYGMETIVETPLTLTPGDVQSTGLRIYGSGTQGKILCLFDTAAILAATQGYGDFPIRVTGRLNGGRSFVCDGSIAILKFGGP